MDKIIESLLKIRTPLTIGGLSVVVFYLLYDKVLELGIFSNLGEASTVHVIGNILNKAFYFALIALVFGVGSYIYLSVKHKKNKSKVTLVDASLDTKSKKYSEKESGGIKKITPGDGND